MTTKPSLEEIFEWFDEQQTKLDAEDTQILDDILTRANKYRLTGTMITLIYENKDEPGFNFIEELEQALFRWDA